MKKFLIAAALIAASARAESLDDAVRAALANNRRVANQRIEIAKAADRVAAVRTQGLPQLKFNVFSSESLTRITFDFPQGLFGVYPGIGPVPAQDTKLRLARTIDNFGLATVTQPITQLRQVAIGTRLAEEARAIEQERLRGERVRVASDVKRLYHGMQQTRAAIAAADAAIAALQQIETTAKRHFEEKTVLRADLLDVQARLAGARATRAALASALATQRQQMNLMLGRPIGQPFEISDAGPEEGELRGDADSRPDVKEVALRVTQAEEDVRLQRAKSLPDVSLVGAYIAPSRAGVVPKSIAAVTLLVSYEPFTWGRRGAEIAEKEKTVEQARNALRDAQEAAAIEIAQKQHAVENARADIATRQLERESAEERLRVAQAKFATDAALLKDVLERQAAAAEAQSKAMAAAEQYWSARAELERALGQ